MKIRAQVYPSYLGRRHIEIVPNPFRDMQLSSADQNYYLDETRSALLVMADTGIIAQGEWEIAFAVYRSLNNGNYGLMVVPTELNCGELNLYIRRYRRACQLQAVYLDYERALKDQMKRRAQNRSLYSYPAVDPSELYSLPDVREVVERLRKDPNLFNGKEWDVTPAGRAKYDVQQERQDEVDFFDSYWKPDRNGFTPADYHHMLTGE